LGLRKAVEAVLQALWAPSPEVAASPIRDGGEKSPREASHRYVGLLVGALLYYMD